MMPSAPAPDADLPPGDPATREANAAPEFALAGDGLHLRYGREPVVHGVSMTLRPGRVTALVGPNGSGKSTLLRALARLHPVAVGRVTLGGRDGAAER
ncbi:MAG: ABC transporter ATP-binding protein, partial [Leucobacter sp.]